MQVEIKQNIQCDEDKVFIECAQITPKIKELAKIIKQFHEQLEVQFHKHILKIELNDILYAESVDGKTFLYSKENIYLYKYSLTQLESQLKTMYFVRISKNTLLNINALKSVEPYINHRLKAYLSNGETLLISRNYIQDVKTYFERKESYL